MDEVVIDVVESTEVVEELAAEVTQVIEVTCEHDAIIELLNSIIQYLDALNSLLVRNIQVVEFFLALMVCVVFCVICYSFLKNFTRF